MKTSLFILTLLIGSSIAHAGVGVDRELSKSGSTSTKSSGSGSNLGGSHGAAYVGSLSAWCKNQTGVLKTYKQRAASKLQNTGDYNAANNILTAGLVRALEAEVERNETFFYKTLKRGLEIATQLEATNAGNDFKKGQNVNNFLNNYYDFATETVARDLDLTGHLPYLGSRNDFEMNQRAAQFEKMFMKYAEEQLKWILTNLVQIRIGEAGSKTAYFVPVSSVRGELDPKAFIIPVGNVDAALKVMLTLSKGIVEDIKDSVWAYRFACSIGSLDLLNEGLTALDQGNLEIYDSKPQALTEATREFKRISSELSCR